ncbi:SPX-domain-containing protein [Parathielavia hyrcaniae]|uniref:SPX-domain-containing protein n=1 Tax=Parathielavia hyrcaniae TaxID=113614 RepID=A0AAN6SZZ0_9PEZI|nr:SPX-domain-containing protein [Parathielavia hyrcaniae]
MKYGQHFEKESVPQWSLHNIDYNSLKHHIKARTTRDQATAIAIPGRPNTALAKFEDEFYAELCRQHDRVDLFVASKADELARRLQHLSSQLHRLILRCATSGPHRISLKKRQRFAKHEQTLMQCGDDIKSLERFVNAQVVAFRKILKKYRKWTGSSTLGARFKDTVLSHPKSFSKLDFSHLQSQYEDLRQTLDAALPADLPGSRDWPEPEPEPQSSRLASSAQLSPSETIVATESQPAVGYWNEYECGSEAGDFDGHANDDYAIYIDPHQDSFPGVKAFGDFFSKPIHTLTAWISPGPRRAAADPERGPLLGQPHGHPAYGGTTRSPPGQAERSYFSTPPGGAAVAASNATTAGTETDLDSPFPSNRHSRRGSVSVAGRNRGYTSESESEEQQPFLSFPPGYSAHYAARSNNGYGQEYYALPSLTEQRLARHRERMLLWAAWGCFGVAFVLMGIAAVLIAAGRHKMRIEVDAGVTLGIMTSLGLACAGLCLNGSRRSVAGGWLGWLAAWFAFAVVCVVDGVLLVLVMGNTVLG